MNTEFYSDQPDQPEHNGDILVVDDTPENLQLLSNLLKDRGYKVRSVTKGAMAIRAAQMAPPDLVLLDVLMPQMNGYEVCEQLKAHPITQGIPVLFISALNEVTDKVRGFQVGGVDYITKPFQVEEVLARVQAHLTIQRLQTKLQDRNHRLQQEMQERQRAQERFTKAFRCCPNPISIVTLDEGRYLEVNDSFVQMSGYSTEEIIGHRMVDLNTELSTEIWDKTVRALLDEGYLVNQEFEIISKSGQIKTILLSIELIDIDGLPCALQIANDITERRRLENEFISLVSHELRTPLGSIMGSLDLIHSGQLGKLTDQGQSVLQIAVSNTERLLRLVNDILDLERMKSGQIALELQPCDLGHLLMQSVETMAPMAEQAGVILKVAPISLELTLDPDRIIQTLTNLLSNAIKFTDPGKIVSLEAEEVEGSVHVQVRDQGRGIPPEKLEQIFDRFQQVHSADARQKGGSGLGLAICRTIVQQHGGRIWAESCLDRGSTFHLHFPK